MDTNKANALFVQYKDIVPSEQEPLLQSALRNAPDGLYENVATIKTYKKGTVILLSIFLGGLGVDRFYIGDVGLGIAKLLFGWATAGLWWFIDIFVCVKKAKEKNMKKIMMSLQ